MDTKPASEPAEIAEKITNKSYTYVEVGLPPGEGTLLHYHLDFEEEFEAIEGTLGKQIIHLRPGEKPACVPFRAHHRFFNSGSTYVQLYTAFPLFAGC